MEQIVLRTKSLCKEYQQGEQKVHALQNVDLSVQSGEIIAIMGRSGSGKSTLLQLLGGLDTPTSGTVLWGKDDVYRLSDNKRTKLRGRRIGFVFQSFNLVSSLTVRKNIYLPVDILKLKRDEAHEQQIFQMLGLKERLDFYPNQLSGGQQQRVAIARALVTRPELLLADEPTGNLDSQSAAEIMRFLQETNQKLGQTILFVTHDASLAKIAKRTIVIADGKIASDRQGGSV